MITPNNIKIFFTRPVAFIPAIAKAVDSVKLGVLLCQLTYWSDKTNDPDGWIYKTQQDIYDETALGRREQETARKIGRDLGILEEKLAGNPATLHFRVNFETLAEVLNEYEKKTGKPLPQAKPTSQTKTIAYLKQLTDEDVKDLAAYYKVTEQFVRDRAEDVITYCEAKGKKYSDYKAALRNFIKSHRERGGSRTPANVLAPKTDKYAKFNK
jgi:hypothetical protein